MIKLGPFLKASRENLGYSLHEISKKTNISSHHLQALEDDEHHQLPSPFYARMYLRTYAKQLGLNIQSILNFYDRSNQGPSAISDSVLTRRGRQALFEQKRTVEPSYNRHLGVSQPPSTYSQRDRQLPMVYSQGIKTESTLSHLPKLDLSAQTLSPRRVALELKQERNKNSLRNRYLSLFLSKKVAIILGGAILIFGSVYLFDTKDSLQASLNEQIGKENSLFVNAGAKNTPLLEEDEISDDTKEGQLYTVKNVDHLSIVIKAHKGESTLFFGQSPTKQENQVTLRVGDTYTLDTKGKKLIWFRLGTPSNVEINVNGQTINTTAQDTEKSYRVELKK